MTEKKKKKLKSLITIHSTSKMDNSNREGKRGGKEKNSKRIYRTSQNIRIMCFSWVTAVRVLSLSGSHSPPHLPRMPSNTVLVSGPAVGTAQILIWSSCVFLPPVSEAIRTGALSVEGALSALYVSHRRSICPVHCVELTCSLYGWWAGVGSSSSATLPLVFNCGFISACACGSSTGDCPWGCPGGLGFAPVRARCGGGAAAWVAGVLAAPGTQGELAAMAAGNTVL